MWFQRKAFWSFKHNNQQAENRTTSFTFLGEGVISVTWSQGKDSIGLPTWVSLVYNLGSQFFWFHSFIFLKINRGKCLSSKYTAQKQGESTWA